MSKSLRLYAVSGLATAFMLTVAYNLADKSIVEVPENPRVMSDAPDSAYAIAMAAADTVFMDRQSMLGLGREALRQEIDAWDLDVSPDGTGLPAGSGSVADGEVLFSDKCATCHGEFAEGVDNWPELAGGEGSLADKDPLKTVGSYWPYLSTAWDYVHRSMPFGAAQTLGVDETYAITAYILYSNDLVEEDFTLSNGNFHDVAMPNADGFIVDDREISEAHFWNSDPCMKNCKESVEITMRAVVLDVTPEEDENESEAHGENAISSPGAETASVDVADPGDSAAAPLDGKLIEAGEKVFKKCKACHQVGEGAANRVGPHLNGVMGRVMAGIDGFKYSGALKEMGAAGMTWNEETLTAFMSDPKGYVKGTRMSFNGLRKDSDIVALTEYLRSFSQWDAAIIQ